LGTAARDADGTITIQPSEDVVSHVYVNLKKSLVNYVP
jgi:hypothetical protein